MVMNGQFFHAPPFSTNSDTPGDTMKIWISLNVTSDAGKHVLRDLDNLKNVKTPIEECNF